MREQKLLDALIVLAVAFALPIFYLMEKIIEFRGNGGDEEKKNRRRKSLSPVKNHPPEQYEPPSQVSMSGACCPIQHLVEKREEVRRDG